MAIILASLFTAALVLVPFAAFRDQEVAQRVVGLVVLLSLVWFLIDASVINVRKDRINGFFNMGRVGWFFSLLLLWIVAFPAYLVKRRLYLEAVEGALPVGHLVIPDPPPAGSMGIQAQIEPAAASTDVYSQIERLAELRDRQVLTDEEFQKEKTRLLARD